MKLLQAHLAGAGCPSADDASRLPTRCGQFGEQPLRDRSVVQRAEHILQRSQCREVKARTLKRVDACKKFRRVAQLLGGNTQRMTFSRVQRSVVTTFAAHVFMLLGESPRSKFAERNRFFGGSAWRASCRPSVSISVV